MPRMGSLLPRVLDYCRLPGGPAPEVLADRLAEANVAAKAAKRIDSYERFFHQHSEHRKAQIKVMLGAAGLVLSVGPSLPALVHACHGGAPDECGLRLSAIGGGLIAMGVTAWSFYDLWHDPVRLSEQVARLNAELARSMHAKNGQVAVDNFFDLYRDMHADERDALRARLHHHARQPRNPLAQARADAQGLEAAELGTIGMAAAAQAGAAGPLSAPEHPELPRAAGV